MSDIRTRPATQEYRDGWERTFGRKHPCPCGCEELAADIKRVMGSVERRTLAHLSINRHGFKDYGGSYHPAPGSNVIVTGLDSE